MSICMLNAVIANIYRAEVQASMVETSSLPRLRNLINPVSLSVFKVAAIRANQLLNKFIGI